MENNDSILKNNRKGLSFTATLTIVLIVLKLRGIIDCSWVLVWSPILVPSGIGLGIIAGVLGQQAISKLYNFTRDKIFDYQWEKDKKKRLQKEPKETEFEMEDVNQHEATKKYDFDEGMDSTYAFPTYEQDIDKVKSAITSNAEIVLTSMDDMIKTVDSDVTMTREEILNMLKREKEILESQYDEQLEEDHSYQRAHK